MKITYGFIEKLLKIFFSLILLQLLATSLLSQAGCIDPYELTDYLEYAAASTLCAAGGGLFCEYIQKNEER